LARREEGRRKKEEGRNNEPQRPIRAQRKREEGRGKKEEGGNRNWEHLNVVNW
jgi:hypothetical protein